MLYGTLRDDEVANIGFPYWAFYVGGFLLAYTFVLPSILGSKNK